MYNKMLKPKMASILLITFLLGCTIQLRSPVKIIKTEEASSSQKNMAVQSSSHFVNTESQKVESPAYISNAAEKHKKSDDKPAKTSSSEVDLKLYTATTNHAEKVSISDIIILSDKYLANTNYQTLGKIIVKDVSESGFTKQKAKEALKYEAFRKFGVQAKGIINVAYKGEISLFGAERFQEASGDVITWEDKLPLSKQTGKVKSEIELTKSQQAAKTKNQAEIRSSSLDATAYEKKEKLPPEKTIIVAESVRKETTNPEILEVSSPADILILSEVDLIDHDFRTLGKVTVESTAKEGFSMEQANNALKREAFKQFKGKARGIINIVYEKKKGLFNIRSDMYRGASGDVVTWEQRKEEKAISKVTKNVEKNESQFNQTYTNEPSSLSEPVTVQPVPPKKILVVAPEELVNIPFKFLGRVKATDDTGRGYDKKRAINALKVEAYKIYEDRARAITNIDFKRKQGILNIEKFDEVSADVVTWEVNDRIITEYKKTTSEPSAQIKPSATEKQIQVPPSESKPIEKEKQVFVSSQEEVESEEEESTPYSEYTEYTTEVTDPDKILILKEEELLTPNFKILGTITIKSPTRFGLREFEADSALKKEALKKFGDKKVRGLIRVQYQKATGLYASDKATKIISATATAITW